MSDEVRCPDCGRANDAGATECAHCGFPLTGAPGVPAVGAPPGAGAAPGEPASPPPGPPAAPAPVFIPRPRRQRPQRADTTSVSLWLVFGTVAALFMVWVAVRSNLDHPKPPVEGANEKQQLSADSLLAIVQRDSTHVDARHALADVLYDTGNWSDAIVQYRATIRMDSTRVPAMVDLGVCYFNLSDTKEAEHLFLLALAKDPHQPVALFNLGILHESRKEWREALRYYHQAIESDPPPAMTEPLKQHMMSASSQLGTKAPPLPEGK